MRILLVDDDTSVLQALLGVLKTLPGHDLKVAATGAKALENADASQNPDLRAISVSVVSSSLIKRNRALSRRCL